MDVTVIKKEQSEGQLVKVEESGEVTTVVLQNISQLGDVQHQIVSPESISHILKNYGSSGGDGNVQIVQLEDGQYTYIIESPETLEDGTQFELEDGDHYIIEEYQGDYEETDQVQYETVYIQSVESPQQDLESSEVYTITEEIDADYAENDQPDDDDDDDDDKPMAIVEDVEQPPEAPVQSKKHPPTIVQKEKLQVKIKQMLKAASVKPAISKETECVPIKQELDYSSSIEPSGNDVPAENDEVLTETEEKKGFDHSDSDEDGSPGQTDIELIYECSICGKTFKTPTGVKRHISVIHQKPLEEKPVNKDVLTFSLCPCCGEPSDSAHTVGDFSCDNCDKLFILQNSLDRHKSIEHPIGNHYECYDCKRTFLTKELLIDHTRVHSFKSVKCEDCGREFSRKYHLERHIGQTGCMGLPRQVYECRVCSKTFTRKDNLAEHLKGHAGIMNKRSKRYMCEFCMKEFSGVALLQIHIRTHTGERPYGCDICEKKFPSSGAMKKHRRKHTGEKPYTCPQCGVKFAAKETLNRHWRTHTGEKPHQCKYCGKAFIQAAQLRAHIFHHTGENAFTCPHCNRAFNRKLRLTTHIKFMHEGAAPLPCPQEGCNKTFFRKEDIHRHSMTHSGEKPYKCEICQKGFAVKSCLRIHQNTHKREQPVSCEVCSRAFIRKDCLMRHMRSRHRDVLEDIVANAEKKRLQTQLFRAVTNAANKEALQNTIVWNELTLTESIKELLGLLVDEECLVEFGHPEAPVDKVLESVIRRCGHAPALESDFDYIGKMRENAKLLFTVVIDDKSVKELLNNQTVDEVIMHVLKLARKQANYGLVEEDIEVKPTVHTENMSEGSEEITLLTDEQENDVDNPESLETGNEDSEDDNTVEYLVEEDSVPGAEEPAEDQMEVAES